MNQKTTPISLHQPRQKHSFHLVSPSPWPILASLAALTSTVGAVMYMHFFRNGGFTLALGLFLLVSVMGLWWRDVVREATFQGYHTKLVQKGLRIGFILFILSEVMFFFAFFWAFFHVSLDPSVEIGAVWPPYGIAAPNPWGIPLLNTYILLLSGVTITATHHALSGGLSRFCLEGLLSTIGLAVLFTLLQGYEYVEAPFSISDGVYGSTFYMTTGFHGLHVVIGTLFIGVCLFRLLRGHFTKKHHLGFEFAVWYWHFVDVVWLFLFVSLYWWGGL